MTTHKTAAEITQAMNKILRDVQREQLRPSGEMRFGAYLRAALSQAGIEPAQFAASLDIDIRLLEGILDGILPESEFDDQLLESMAEALHEDVNVLHVFLGRTVNTRAIDSKRGAAVRRGSNTK